MDFKAKDATIVKQLVPPSSAVGLNVLSPLDVFSPWKTMGMSHEKITILAAVTKVKICPERLHEKAMANDVTWAVGVGYVSAR